MKGTSSNKGFSLVELIIVIAIMAVIVGIAAPKLIQVIEKSKVSADTQICDSLHSAIVIALSDPDVVTATDSSKDWIEVFTTPNRDILLYSGAFGGSYLDCEFTRCVSDIVGYNPWTTSYSEKGLKSTPADGHPLLPCAIVNENGTDFAVYVAWSDRTGHKEGENFNGAYSELEDSKVIYVK